MHPSTASRTGASSCSIDPRAGAAVGFPGTRRAMSSAAMNPVELPVNATSGSESRIGRSVSLDDAARLLGVSRRTIYNRIREGRLQTIRTLGGSQRVLVESVAGIEDGSSMHSDDMLARRPA